MRYVFCSYCGYYEEYEPHRHDCACPCGNGVLEVVTKEELDKAWEPKFRSPSVSTTGI